LPTTTRSGYWPTHLRFREGEGAVEHELDTGDCLQLRPPAPCPYVNPTDSPSRYLVVLTKRGS
jgi:hypothetical protein